MSMWFNIALDLWYAYLLVVDNELLMTWYGLHHIRTLHLSLNKQDFLADIYWNIPDCNIEIENRWGIPFLPVLIHPSGV